MVLAENSISQNEKEMHINFFNVDIFLFACVLIKERTNLSEVK